MTTARYAYWRDGNHWLGSSRKILITSHKAKLQNNLRDLFHDLTGGEIPGVRRVAELYVS